MNCQWLHEYIHSSAIQRCNKKNIDGLLNVTIFQNIGGKLKKNKNFKYSDHSIFPLHIQLIEKG